MPHCFLSLSDPNKTASCRNYKEGGKKNLCMHNPHFLLKSTSMSITIPNQGVIAKPLLLPHLRTDDNNKNRKFSGVVRYKECLKNHAAAIGGCATDGCGEFMAGGEEGTLEALKCSACNCHRNFHRKILMPAPPQHGGAAVRMESMCEVAQGKKRFRTKFDEEQKEKMLRFAEKAGWKMQKADEAEVRRLCEEIGVKRKVLKVWMHNNKYNFANKTDTVT